MTERTTIKWTEEWIVSWETGYAAVGGAHPADKARQIAAAPDMLEALEYLLTRLESIEDIRVAQDAIAKAKGERE